MQLLPAARSRVSQRAAIEIFRSSQMCRAALPPLRLALHLDRIALGSFDAGQQWSEYIRRRARRSAAQPNAREGARPSVRTAALLVGSRRGLLRPVELRHQLS